MAEENKQLAVYQDYRVQVDEFKIINDSIVFDYKSKKGNKDARSHIAKMKKVIAAVEKKRIAAAKEYREKCNDQSDEIKAEIDAMILVHQKPLDEFENREKIRIEEIKGRIDNIFTRNAGITSEDIQAEIDFVNDIDIDDAFWEEFLGELLSSIKDRLTFLKARLEARVQYEADQAELEKLRQEKADREAQEELDRIEKKNLKDTVNFVDTAEYHTEVIDPRDKVEYFGHTKEISRDEAEEMYPAKDDKSEVVDNAPNPEIGKNAEHPSSFGVSTKKGNPKKLAAINAFVDHGYSLTVAQDIVRRIGYGQIPHTSIDLTAD